MTSLRDLPPPASPRFARRWLPNMSRPATVVETLQLREGFELVLSQIAGDEGPFQFTETADVFGIGFHLKGGAAFEMQGARFETKPLDIWACAAPRGSCSSFQLPAQGFQTVALRFTPDVLEELLTQHSQADGQLRAMATTAHERVAATRLAPLDAANARMVAAMFTTPYRGAARSLFLESCALRLLARQLDAESRISPIKKDLAEVRQMRAARAWLDENLDEPPTIMELARIIGINDFKLKRSFKATFGTTIFGYVRQRRMEQAAARLNDGLSVAEAAYAAGYACPRCFSEAFRRHYGILPSGIKREA